MVSNLEKLSSALRTLGKPVDNEASRLAHKIKSDPQIQEELAKTGQASVRDDSGRSFLVRKKVTESAVAGR